VLPVGGLAGACVAAPSHRHTEHPLPCPAPPPPLPAPGGRPCPQLCPQTSRGSGARRALRRGQGLPGKSELKGARAELGQNRFLPPGHHHIHATDFNRPPKTLRLEKGRETRWLQLSPPSRPSASSEKLHRRFLAHVGAIHPLPPPEGRTCPARRAQSPRRAGGWLAR